MHEKEAAAPAIMREIQNIFRAMGICRPVPNALGDTFRTGGACRRLYSAFSTIAMTERTRPLSNPQAEMSSTDMFFTRCFSSIASSVPYGGSVILWQRRTDSGCPGGRGRGAQSRLRLLVLLPALGSQAEQVGLAVPCIARSRGIQRVTANQPGPRIRIC